MHHFLNIMKGLLVAPTLLLCVQAQNITTDFSTWFNVTTFPKQQFQNVSQFLSKAQETAGQDVWPHFMHRCIRAQAYPELSSGTSELGFIQPSSPFQNVFFVGHSGWSSWAIDTGNRELLLIDTLATPEEAEGVIIPGLKKFGYTGKDVKHIIVTHEHTDHFGGVAYFQQRFNPYVYASEVAWGAMAKSQFNPPQYKNYSNARLVGGGETLRINNFAVKVFNTPGHTPGTISLQFDVFDNASNRSHIAGLYGGGGIPKQASAMAQQVGSWNGWSELSRKAGVDVLLSNHQNQDHSLWNFDLLKYRQCNGSECNMPNPFVIGVDAYARYAKVMALCVQIQAARDGVNLSSATVSKRDVTEESCD